MSDLDEIPSSESSTPKKATQRGGRAPVSSQTRARVRKLGREGLSQAQIANRTGISRKSVAKICAEARPPITFDRSHTAKAVEAHQIDMKAKRAELAQLLLMDAFTLRAAALEDKTVKILSEEMVERGITDPVEFTVEREGRDIQARFTSVGIVIDKHLLLVRTDSDDRDLPAVDAWLQLTLGRTA